MPKITEDTAAKIKVPPGAREVLVFDTELRGFGIRKFASGRASFFVKFEIGTKFRRMTLGAVVPGNLKDMRLEASRILAKVRLGEDPAAEKAERRAKAQRVTLGQLIPKYLAQRQEDMRPRSFLEVERHLLSDWRPLHDRAVSEISRSDIVAVIDAIAEGRGHKVAADRARSALGTFFGWAIDRGHVETTPVLHIKSRSQDRGRSRVLTEPELAEVWRACRDDAFGRIVKLLILTAQRKSEIGDLEWSEINEHKREIRLPGRRTKNAREHTIPLCDAALQIIHQIDRIEGRDKVFGFGRGGFSGWSRAKGELDGRILSARAKLDRKAEPMPPWVLHDLRRTAATHMNERGFGLPHVVEGILNHASGHKGGVAGVYNHAPYAREKRRALDLWGAHIAGVLAGIPAEIVEPREVSRGR